MGDTVDWSTNYFGIADFDPVRFATKHKPKFRTLPDGRAVVEIHPEDAHLFEECEVIDDPEATHG